MGSENHHHPLHHHQFYHKNLQIHHKSTFLPMLCSRPSSIKDVSVPAQCRGASARSFSNDPLQSPRISCTGQVKRHNNKVAGIPSSSSHRFSIITPKSTKTTTITTTISSSPIVKYSKLKRLFSRKNLSSTPTTDTVETASSCGNRLHLQLQQQPQVTANSADVLRVQKCRSENLVPIVSIENMDPPLPVIKRVHKSEEESHSLWKRRSGSTALKSLQLQHIPNPRHKLQVTSV